MIINEHCNHNKGFSPRTSNGNPELMRDVWLDTAVTITVVLPHYITEH